MHPFVIYGYFCWYLLSEYLILDVVSGSPGHFFGNLTDSNSWQGDYSASFLSDNSDKSSSIVHQTYTVLPPSNNSVSCEDLEGVGSFNTTCILNSDLKLNSDIYIYGTGNLEILSHVTIACPLEGCLVSLNLSGSVKLGPYASVIAGSVVFVASSVTIDDYAIINTTSLGGPPPPQTSGTPVGHNGAGGGHGGRGASCSKVNQTNFWGGDVYSWSNLSDSWSYGSKGGSTSKKNIIRGNGGGRVKLILSGILYLNGSVTAEGGDGGPEMGGGSGGSIIIRVPNLKGLGTISAAGGKGWGGGGGGRISTTCYSIQEGIKIAAHGGFSIGCPGNAGAAGTYFDGTLRSLRVENDNYTTETETPLLDFSTTEVWSNVFVENNAKVLVPLLWTRVQVRGQIKLLCGGSIVFGLSEYPVSEFELVAEELLMSDSTIKVYGALRLAVKMLLMWNSRIQIDGGGNTVVTTSILEIRNLVVLTENSIIRSTTNLGLYGQGLLKLTGNGDVIKAQRLLLALFYNITVGHGSLLQAPLDDDVSKSMVTQSQCESQACPTDLISPPDDCHVNNTLSFSLQICRVEDLLVNGLIKGSIIHIHRARTVIVDSDGLITASELGCRNGIGEGNFSNGVGSGAGHGGKGGSGFYRGSLSEGGKTYGSADLPCEMGSGTEGPNKTYESVAGGGIIVMGSILWPLIKLDIYGSLVTNGQSSVKETRNSDGTLFGGLGGGSGGTILLFLEALMLADNSSLSAIGGNGGALGGGGGGGGRIHFHWSKINVGDEYVPVATISGSINRGGGTADTDSTGSHGEHGSMTGKKCPRGLYGTFCNECPMGTYKDVVGSDERLCLPCSLAQLPSRAEFMYVRGGVVHPSCPYECISDKYRMPNCYTPMEELLYTFGGPWPFAFLLSCTLVFVALLLSTLRIKLVGTGSYSMPRLIEHNSHNCFPHLLSLTEVREVRMEETQSHAHRMYFMGPNTFREPWHLPYSPPSAIIEIVYEDAFNRFIDEINSVAAYDWWEGSVHSILSMFAYPCAWSWKQWRRRRKICRLQEFVKSEYDHSCLRSCRSRALYKGMKVGATQDLMVAYLDFFLGGDEKRLAMVAIIQQRFPMCIIFGGDGSYMSPYNLYSDPMLTSLLGQHVPATVWNRLVAGLNAQLRTVRHGSIRSALLPLIDWLSSHGNPQLGFHGVKLELRWFQATASGYYQLGILAAVGEYSDGLNRSEEYRRNNSIEWKSFKQPYASHALSRKRITGGINGGLINGATLRSLDVRRDFFFPFSLLLHNTRPVGCQDILQLLITLMLLVDLSVTALTLLQFYWVSLAAFLAILLVLPLSLLFPFPAGLNAIFSKEPRRASLSRIYALWNATSLSNITVSFICGLVHYGLYSVPEKSNSWNFRREDDKWWLLPATLVLLKSVQARFVDWHIANLEVEDLSVFSTDPDSFWAHQSS